MCVGACQVCVGVYVKCVCACVYACACACVCVCACVLVGTCCLSSSYVCKHVSLSSRCERVIHVGACGTVMWVRVEFGGVKH